MNAGQQCWKACWGQPLRSSNLLSSAAPTCGNADSLHAAWDVEQAFVSVFVHRSAGVLATNLPPRHMVLTAPARPHLADLRCRLGEVITAVAKARRFQGISTPPKRAPYRSGLAGTVRDRPDTGQLTDRITLSDREALGERARTRSARPSCRLAGRPGCAVTSGSARASLFHRPRLACAPGRGRHGCIPSAPSGGTARPVQWARRGRRASRRRPARQGSCPLSRAHRRKRLGRNVPHRQPVHVPEQRPDLSGEADRLVSRLGCSHGELLRRLGIVAQQDATVEAIHDLSHARRAQIRSGLRPATRPVDMVIDRAEPAFGYSTEPMSNT